MTVSRIDASQLAQTLREVSESSTQVGRSGGRKYIAIDSEGKLRATIDKKSQLSFKDLTDLVCKVLSESSSLEDKKAILKGYKELKNRFVKSKVDSLGNFLLRLLGCFSGRASTIDVQLKEAKDVILDIKVGIFIDESRINKKLVKREESNPETPGTENVKKELSFEEKKQDAISIKNEFINKVKNAGIDANILQKALFKDEMSFKDCIKFYKKLALSMHPDRTGNDKKKEEQLKEVITAYDEFIKILQKKHPADGNGKIQSLIGYLEDLDKKYGS